MYALLQQLFQGVKDILCPKLYPKIYLLATINQSCSFYCGNIDL